jgi:hypothetical protein
MLIDRAETLDGTTGGTINVRPDLKVSQITIAGRATGTITITGTAKGGDIAEAVSGGSLDLSSERTLIVDGYAMESFTIVPDSAGDDFTVTISQWPV